MLESLLDKFEEHCYRLGIEIVEFIRMVIDVCNLSIKFRIPLEELSSHITKMKRKLFELEMDIIEKKKELGELMQKIHVAEMQLREVCKGKPLIERLRSVEGALAFAARQLIYAHMDIHRLRGLLNAREYEYKVLAANANNRF